MDGELKYQRIIRAVTETPWAILPQKLAVIRDLLTLRAAGGKLTADEIRERLDAMSTHHEAASGNGRSNRGNVAVIPLVGTIVPRADAFTEMSGGVSVQRFTKAFRQALTDPEIGSIVIDVDSPGGQVGGVEELSSEIFQARGQKRIVAVANNLAASAAYWIGTAADELVITPSGEVGSIGVFAMHEDVATMMEMMGVKVNLIAAGKYKVEGNPFESLSDEARSAIQGRVNDYYDAFVKAVARNRGVKASDVRNGYGQGRVVGAKEAVELGMADRIATLDETIERMINGRRPRQMNKADSAVLPGADGETAFNNSNGGIQMNNEMVQVPVTFWDKMTAALFPPKEERQPEGKPEPQPTPPQADNAQLAAITAENERLATEVEKLKAEQARNKRVAHYAAELQKTVFEGDAELAGVLASMPDEQAAVLATRFKAVAAQEKLAAVTKPVGGTGDADGTPQETLHDVTLRYATEHRVSYPVALEATMKARPELVKDWQEGGK